MTPQETFVTRLRRQRMRTRVSLEQIADVASHQAARSSRRSRPTTCPSGREGLYSRAWIRAYALAVDLDPVDTVDEFCRLFPQGDRRAGGTIQEIAAIVASPSEYRDEFGHPEGRRASDQTGRRLHKAAWHAFVTQPGRALWTRLTRSRRVPRAPRAAYAVTHAVGIGTRDRRSEFLTHP